jgi:flagellar hook-associated protein 2
MDSITINTGGAIDVSAIVTALMEVESVPMNRLEANALGVRSTISEIGRLQSALSSFQDAARELKDADTWQAAAGASSDDDSVTISATGGALQGSFAVQVNQLASHQTIVSDALGDKTAVMGGGTLTLQMGGDAQAQTISIASGSSLEDVSAAINAADAGIGASLVTDADGTRIMIRSSESGADQSFTLSASSDGSGEGGLNLAALSHSGQDGSMTQTQSAANALFELNGLALESRTNRPEGVLENVALTLNSVTTSPVELDVSSDQEAIRERMDGFIAAYNELNTLIQSQTRYDAESQTAGPLQGNRTVLMVQSQLRDIIRTTLPDDSQDADDQYRRLSDVGISVQRDGSLALDASRFELAAVNPNRLAAMFGGNGEGEDDSSDGFARQLDDTISNLLSVDGAVTGATDTLRRREDLIESQQDRLSRRLDDIEARLIRQYTSLDANLSQLNGALQTVSQL